MEPTATALSARLHAALPGLPLAEDLQHLQTDHHAITDAATALRHDVEEATHTLQARVSHARQALAELRHHIAESRARADQETAAVQTRLAALGRKASQEQARLSATADKAEEAFADFSHRIDGHATQVHEASAQVGSHLDDTVTPAVAGLQQQLSLRSEHLHQRLQMEVLPGLEHHTQRLLSHLSQIDGTLRQTLEHSRHEAGRHGDSWVQQSRHHHEHHVGLAAHHAEGGRQLLHEAGGFVRMTTTGLSAGREGVATASMAANAGLQVALGILQELLELFGHLQ